MTALPWLRPLGSTGLTVSALCAGGSPIGNLEGTAGDETAVEVVDAVLDSPVTFLDTSNGYGQGRSEQRIGEAVRRRGGLPDGVLLATKVDALDGDYSGARVRRSFEESCARLGLRQLPLLYLHDPEFHDTAAMTGPGGAVAELVRLKEEGLVGHLGLAGGDVQVMSQYLDLGVFEVLLNHNRWSLVDRSATALFAQAAGLGVAVVNAAVHGGGFLVADETARDRYGYRPANAATLAARTAMSEVCERHGTDLRTAALQFSLRDPSIASTVVGFSRPDRVADLLASAAADLPAELWDDLEALLPTQENWLDAEEAR